MAFKPGGDPCEMGALFTMVSSIRVSRISGVRVTLTVTVRVNWVSIMVSVRANVQKWVPYSQRYLVLWLVGLVGLGLPLL